MKIILSVLAISLLPLLLWQCNRTSYTPATFPETDYLSFGSGGGYAGALTTHYLLPNGQLFTTEGIVGEKVPAGKISARKAKRLIQEYQDSLSSVQYDVPGNAYYFLEWTGAVEKHKIQWAKGQDNAPAAAADFYKQLLAQLPKDK